MLYAAAIGYPLRSTDNGVSWQQLTGASNDYYYSIQGDGTDLFILGARGGTFMVSPETDGEHWSAYNSQTFCEGAATLTFDSDNQIMYSAGKTCGLWATKVPEPPTTIKHSTASLKSLNGNLSISSQTFRVIGDRFVMTKEITTDVKTVELYNVNGKLIDRAMVGEDGVVKIDRSKIGRQAVIVR